MLILKYFNSIPIIVQDQGLPEPTSSLSNFVPPKAIKLTNTEVEKVKKKDDVVLGQALGHMALRHSLWIVRILAAFCSQISSSLLTGLLHKLICMISSYHGIQRKCIHHHHFLLSSQVCCAV